jgi:hypothetical protein
MEFSKKGETNGALAELRRIGGSMRYLVEVRVDSSRLREFGGKLQRGELDRSAIRSETYCLKEDPAVGYSVWEAEGREAFEVVFASWRPYYAEARIREIVEPGEAMRLLAEARG